MLINIVCFPSLTQVDFSNFIIYIGWKIWWNFLAKLIEYFCQSEPSFERWCWRKHCYTDCKVYSCFVVIGAKYPKKPWTVIGHLSIYRKTCDRMIKAACWSRESKCHVSIFIFPKVLDQRPKTRLMVISFLCFCTSTHWLWATFGIPQLSPWESVYNSMRHMILLYRNRDGSLLEVFGAAGGQMMRRRT